MILSGLTVISSATQNTILLQIIASQSSHENSTLADRIQTSIGNFSTSLVLVTLIPFLLLLVFTLLFMFMFSLPRHLGHMRDHRLGLYDHSTQAHMMALKSFAFFFIFYTLYFISLIIIAMKMTTFQNHWHWTLEVVTYVGVCIPASWC